MEKRIFKIYSEADNRVALKVIPGHFVTSHSHINYYVDLTTLQARQSEAEAAAKLLARKCPQHDLCHSSGAGHQWTDDLPGQFQDHGSEQEYPDPFDLHYDRCYAGESHPERGVLWR